MTLKTDYLDGATGLTQKMQAVFDAGVLFVSTTFNAAISTALIAAAASGKSSFTSTHVTSFETANLRLNGTHRDTYFAGILKGFADEGIFEYEVPPSLDATDSSTTSVILTFTL